MPVDEAIPVVKKGRPAFDPKPAQRVEVERMYGLGLRETDIADILNISPKTLRKHFRKELKLGQHMMNDKVLTRLYEQATRGHVAATIFWAKTRCGWQTRPTSPPDPPDVPYICEPVLNEGEPNA